MMNLALQQQEKQITELALTPALRVQLEACLSTYAAITTDLDLLEEQAGVEKSKIGKILADYGVDKVKADEFSLCWVRGSTTKKLDLQKLIAQGVTLAQIEAATTERPKKDYFQIRGANDRTGASD